MSDSHGGNGTGEHKHPERRNIETTTDLALMAFYMLKGIELVKVERRPGGNFNDCDFLFDDPDGRSSDLRVEWANSTARLYDGCTRTLRKMVQEMKGRRRGRRSKNKKPAVIGAADQ